jgi:hypothetical protein
MGLRICLDTPCGTGRFVFYRTNKRFRQHPWPGSAPAAHLNVSSNHCSNDSSNDEEYQIAFWRDNLFLLYLSSEITLTNPHEERRTR